MIRAGLIAILTSLAGMAPAGDLSFDWPVDCIPDQTCFVQNHVDRDPTPAARDFTCGALTYDGHQGTDIALLDHVALADGVTVRAAAAGTVLRLRNDRADWTRAPFPQDRLDGQFCGNGVIIDHGGGWETQYCHLREGSIPLRPGQALDAGAPLGLIGLSGRTDFPHLHFVIRKDGVVMDPFLAGAQPCGVSTARTLWSDPVAYRATGLVNLGIADHLPDFDAVKHGAIARARPGPDAPALVFWAQIFGGQAGDRLDMTLTGPDGPIAARGFALDRDQARLYRALGRKRQDAPWPGGIYRGTVTLVRDGQPVLHHDMTLTLP